jgi:hypothetical protein
MAPAVDQRDQHGLRARRPDGRPPFGLGPIGRVGSAAPSTAIGYGALERPAGPAGRPAAGGAGPAGRSAAGPAMMVATPSGRGAIPARAEVARARAFGLPNLRRNVCPHFFVTGSRGAIPIHAPHLLKALVRQDANVSRCQLRGGVHLEQGYVNDVCLSARFNQCVFYEEHLPG